MAVTILLFILITCVYVIFLKRNNKILQLVKKIPGPPTLPLLGNTLAILKHTNGDLLSYICKSQEEYGAITRYWFGPKLQIFLSDPNDVKIILKDTENINKSTMYDFFLPWLGNGVSTIKNKNLWHFKRKLVSPALYYIALEKFVKIFSDKGNILIKELKRKENNGIFDITPYVEKYAFDTILETLMGVHSNQQEEDEKCDCIIAVNKLADFALARASNVLLHPDFIFSLTKLGKEQKKHLDAIDSYCRKVLTEKKTKIKDMEEEQLQNETEQKHHENLLDLLLTAQKNGSGYSDQDVLYEINNFLFGGDTISAAMAFCIYHLAKNQDIQEKAFKEIRQLFGDKTNSLTIRNVQDCRYIEMGIKESLRITPPIPIFARHIDKDIKLKNYTVPAGTDVNIFTYMLHNNPKVYSNPEKFDPERFSTENIRQIDPYAFVPFSAGPRNCLGQKYAMLELKVFVIKVLSNYRILPGEDIRSFVNSNVLKSSNGIKIKLENRIRY